MLHLLEIKNLSQNIGIAPLNIIREYFEIEVLNELSKSNLSERLIFYGGTAIRLTCSGERFSEDLDFIFEKQSKNDFKELSNILKNVSKKNDGVQVEEIHEKRNTLFGLLHITNPILKHPIRIKIEISKKTHRQKTKYMMIVSPTSLLHPIIKTSTIDSLAKNKLYAIKMRNEPRDWYDLWFINKKVNSDLKPKKRFPFNHREFENELKRWLPRNHWKIIPGIISYYE